MVAEGNAYISAVKAYNNAASGKSFNTASDTPADDIKQGEFAGLVRNAIAVSYTHLTLPTKA